MNINSINVDGKELLYSAIKGIGIILDGARRIAA